LWPAELPLRLDPVDKLGHFHRCWCAIAAHANRLRVSIFLDVHDVIITKEAPNYRAE